MKRRIANKIRGKVNRGEFLQWKMETLRRVYCHQQSEWNMLLPCLAKVARMALETSKSLKAFAWTFSRRVSESVVR